MIVFWMKIWIFLLFVLQFFILHSNNKFWYLKGFPSTNRKIRNKRYKTEFRETSSLISNQNDIAYILPFSRCFYAEQIVSTIFRKKIVIYIYYFQFDDVSGFKLEVVGVPRVFRNRRAQQYFFNFWHI